MPNTAQLSDLLRPLVDRFVTEIEGIVRQAAVKAIQDSIGGGGAAAAVPARRKPGRPPKSAAAAPAPAPKAAPKAAAKPAAAAPAPKAKAGGTRIRRSPEQIETAAQRILGYIRSNPNQGAEVIKSALGLRKQDWMLPITRLLDTKQVIAKGEKRSRTYSTK